MGSSDDDLLSQAASGDGRALAELLEEHTSVVRQRLAGKIPRRWQSVLSLDDVMQETYTDAFLDIDRFTPEGDGSFTAWLMSLARCNLVDALRMLKAEKRGGNHQRVEPQTREDSCVALYEVLGATQTTPSRCAAREEARAALEHAIQQLPETYRRVVQMYDFEDRPVEEVGRALKRSAGAVYMVRARAHRRLQAIMGSVSKYITKA